MPMAGEVVPMEEGVPMEEVVVVMDWRCQPQDGHTVEDMEWPLHRVNHMVEDTEWPLLHDDHTVVDTEWVLEGAVVMVVDTKWVLEEAVVMVVDGDHLEDPTDREDQWDINHSEAWVDPTECQGHGVENPLEVDMVVDMVVVECLVDEEESITVRKVPDENAKLFPRLHEKQAIETANWL